MPFDFVELAADVGEFALEAVDVGSEVLSDGAEFLSDGFIDGIDQLQDQVGDFAGEADWFDANYFGDITELSSTITDLDPTVGGLFTEVDGIFVLTADLETEAFNNFFDGAKEALGIPTQLGEGAGFGGDLLTKAGLVADDFTKAISEYFTPANISKTVTDFAVQQAKQLVAQAVAQVVPPALQPYLNQAINAAVKSASATAVPVGTAYDDDGNLNIGWTLQENGDPLFVGGGFIDATGEFLDKAAAVKDPNIAALIDAGIRGAADFVKEKLPAAVNDPNIAALITGSEPARALLRSLASTGTVNDPGLATPPKLLIDGLDPALQLNMRERLAEEAAAAARVQGLLRQAQNQQTARIQSNNNAATGDWRVRLQLADSSDYLYNAPDCGPLLWPLRDTNGVIFPYTPTIDMVYKANYATYDLTHSNYRGYFYQSSNIDGVNIKGTFTAQDSAEANYLLAVIHFFRSVTKMFYGQDAQRGTPPPLVFLSGLGDFQFNRHPCVVSQFSYSLPADVNYIRAQSTVVNGGNQLAARTRQTTLGNPIASTLARLSSVVGPKIFPGAVTAPFAPQGSLAVGNPTYVPTKMEISLVLFPIQSRSQVSQQFSLRGFANGNLLKGGFW